MRVKIVFGYDGEKFNGFQILPNKRTIQGELEKSLTKLLNEEIKIIASGRTDAGVSAIYQVAHFDTSSTIIATNISFAVNKILPNDIDFYTFEQIYHDALVELNLNEHINTLINKIIKD